MEIGFHPGYEAPSFNALSVKNGNVANLDSTMFRGQMVLLLFYPVDYGYICSSELTLFNEKLSEFKRENCEVIALSTGNIANKLAFVSAAKEDGGVGGLDIPLVEDREGKIGEAFGVMRDESGYSFRAIVLLDKNGIVVFRSLTDLPVGVGVSGALDMVKKYNSSGDGIQRYGNTEVESGKDESISEELQSIAKAENASVEIKDGPQICSCGLKFIHSVNLHKYSTVDEK